MLRVPAARVAPAEDRRPAGEKLDGRADGQRLHLWDEGADDERASPLEERPVHGNTLHRARAGRREATLLGREARRPATGA